MPFTTAERDRFGPQKIHRWQLEEWFPTNLSGIAALVNHALARYQRGGVTQQMLDDAAYCCPQCEIVTVDAKRGLHFARRPGGKMDAMARLLRNLHGVRHLPPLRAYWCDHDVFVPPLSRQGYCSSKLLPIFVHAKPAARKRDDYLNGLIAAPENTFFMAYGGNSDNWESTRRLLLAAGHAVPWARRRDRLYFRGSGSGYRKFLNYSNDGRVPLEGAEEVKLSTRARAFPYVPLVEQCANKYLLHLPGAWPGHSNKLKWLMACGAVVVMPQNDWHEFWYPLLQPYETFIPTENLAQTNGRDLPAVRRCLMEHDLEAERIASLTHQFVEQTLTTSFIFNYTRELLTRYAALLSSKATATKYS